MTRFAKLVMRACYRNIIELYLYHEPILLGDGSTGAGDKGVGCVSGDVDEG